jgi:hypothetical protein
VTAKIAKDAKKKISTSSEFGFQQGSCRDFHNGRSSRCFCRRARFQRKSQKQADPRNEMPRAESQIAPKMRHQPVDGMHSIDF